MPPDYAFFVGLKEEHHDKDHAFDVTRSAPSVWKLGRENMLGARFFCSQDFVKRGLCVIASSSREASPTAHPLHFQSGPDSDDNHHYASPA